ncbi:MAG: RDD family protein [Candidatus Accumulibacter sp. SK-11]|nr:MAG: RDD family protein [Candidatus Accumulibacter sp. SK-11]
MQRCRRRKPFRRLPLGITGADDVPLVLPAGRPGIARRLASMCYESLLVLAVLAVLLVLPHLVLGAFAQRMASPVLIQAHCFLVLLIYFVWFWLHGGQTLAMKTWRIRLVTRDGLPVRPAQALLRYLLCWPSILSGVGIFWAVLDREGQFLHDRLAGTRLILA